MADDLQPKIVVRNELMSKRKNEVKDKAKGVHLSSRKILKTLGSSPSNIMSSASLLPPPTTGYNTK